MNIRFINTTTILPVDEELESTFLKAINPHYLQAIESISHRTHCHNRFIDVFFVSKEELDFERMRIRNGIFFPEKDINNDCDDSDMDLLGVYFSFHYGFNRSVIKISPEKIIEACVGYNTNNKCALSFERMYSTLLISVIVHELAHFIMDAYDNFLTHDLIPWSWLVTRLEEDDASIDRLDRQHFRHQDYSRECNHKLWHRYRHFIEESLANAFVLRQNISKAESDFLKAFMATEPSGYRHGIFWHGSIQSVLNTATSWQNFKNEIDRHCEKWDYIFDDSYTPLETILNKLNNGLSIGSIDFMKIFYKHLSSRVGSWQNFYTKDKQVWDDRLNGTFGVYWMLSFVGQWHGVSQAQKIKFIKQWAKNGSYKGIDEMHKALAEQAVEKKQYTKAFKHHNLRLINLPKLDENEYWHNKHEDEIKKTLSDLSALRPN